MNTFAEYLGKLNFNIFWNISFLPWYCHSVQTDSFELHRAVCATKLLWCNKRTVLCKTSFNKRPQWLDN